MTSILPYPTAPIVFFPLSPEQPLAWNSADTDAFRRERVAPFWHAEFEQFSDHPTHLTRSWAELGSLLRDRRLQTSFGQAELGRLVGTSRNRLCKLEMTGKPIVNLAMIQVLCYLFNLRFNFLPSLGPPLVAPEEQLYDFTIRCLTLLTDPQSQDFAAQTQTSFSELAERFEKKQISESLFDLLTDQFHMRLWPPHRRRKKYLTPTTFPEFATNLRSLSERWHIGSQEEMGRLLGFTPHEIKRTLLHPLYQEPARIFLAEKLGFQVAPKTPTSPDLLNETGPFVFDHKLAQELERKRRVLGWTKKHLSKQVNMHPEVYEDILATLKTPFTGSAKGLPKAWGGIYALCSLLKIKVITINTLRPVPCRITQDWKQAVPLLLREYRKRRLSLRLSYPELIRLMSENNRCGKNKIGIGKFDTIKKVEQGEINRRSMAVAENLFGTLKIVYDPFEHIQPLLLPPETTKEDVLTLVQQRLESTFISLQRLTKLVGITSAKLYNLITGRVSLSHPELQKICRLFKIYTQLSTSEEVTRTNNRLYQWAVSEAEQQLNAVLVQEQLGLSEHEYYTMRGGNFEAHQPLVNRMDQLTQLTPEIKNNTSQQEWLNIILTKITEQAETAENLAARLNIDPSKLNAILAGAFYWNDPAVLALGRYFRLYSYEMRQCELENNSRSTKPIEGFFTNFSLLSPAQIETRTKRHRLLKEYLREREINAGQINLLEQSGGTPEHILAAPLSYVLYLYSLGDVMSLVYYAVAHQLEYATVVEKYTLWVKQTYGVSIQPAQLKKVTGKKYEIRFFSTELATALSEQP